MVVNKSFFDVTRIDGRTTLPLIQYESYGTSSVGYYHIYLNTHDEILFRGLQGVIRIMSYLLFHCTEYRLMYAIISAYYLHRVVYASIISGCSDRLSKREIVPCLVWNFIRRLKDSIGSDACN